MEIGTEYINKWLVASLHGAFTIKNTSSLQPFLEEAINNEHKLLALDLTNVPFLDSSAIGTIITTKKQIEKNFGYLCIFGANETITDIFETVRLSKHITIYRDKDDFLMHT